MGKKRTKKADVEQIEDQRPTRVAYGGSLIRDFTNLPGKLEKFVHATRSFTNVQFTERIEALEGCFGKTNRDPVLTDEGITFPAGELFSLGAEGHSAAGKTVLVFKFIPIADIYPPHDFRSLLDVGEILEVI